MTIRHDAEGGRFLLEREGKAAVLEYQRPSAGVLHILRTWVPPSFRGGGQGARLVKAALEHAREEDLRVVSSCWFVDSYVERNPGYRDLMAE